jgi:lipoate-protein ligase B
LESSIINLCTHYVVEAFRTGDTGVWCSTPNGDGKIAAIGIHLSRNITSHGVGINITNEVLPYFNEIDACGLGKGVTSLESMGVKTTREDVETKWVTCLGKKFGCTVRVLKDVGELEEQWGMKKGEILDVLVRDERDLQL